MFREILPNCFVLYGHESSCNCYLLKGKKIVLIDSGLKTSGPDIEQALKALGLNPLRIQLVLHTHGHVDHFSADYLFRRAVIRMHGFDAVYVERQDPGFTCAGYFPFDASWFPRVYSFLKEGELIDLGEFKLKAINTPGHTKGSLCFWEEEKGLLFSGDTLFHGNTGRTDLPSGSKSDLIESLQGLQELNFDVLCPGHGLILKGQQKQNLLNCLAGLK